MDLFGESGEAGGLPQVDNAEEITATDNYIHGPVRAGSCRLCHDAHGTDQKAMLLLPGNESCLDFLRNNWLLKRVCIEIMWAQLSAARGIFHLII